MPVKPDFTVNVAPRENKVIRFVIDGGLDKRDTHIYSFKLPKQAALLKPILDGDANDEVAMTSAMFKWLSDNMSKEDYQRITQRLEDDKDGFDIDNLSEIVQEITGISADRPTM